MRRLLSPVMLVVGFGLITALAIGGLMIQGPADVTTYLAAGERLNAGHPLYALSPGDRMVPLDPGRYTVPLLSPPLLAVIWRPLAAIGAISVWVWWVAMAICLFGSLVFLARRVPLLTGIVMLTMIFPLSFQLLEGNVNAFVVAGTIATWAFLGSGNDRAAGALVALLVGLKSLPVFLVLWLIAQRRRSAVIAFVVISAILVAIAIAGAGLDSFGAYLEVRPGPSLLSLTGLADHILGIDDATGIFIPYAVAIACCAGMFVWRSRRGLTFAMVIVAMIWGTPAVSTGTLALLIAALSPIAQPTRVPTRGLAGRRLRASVS